MTASIATPAVLIAAFALATTVVTSQDRAIAPKGPALLQDYIAFTVTAPPAALELDPFYKKYVDAHGIPVVTSDKVPDAALLMARDIVQFMLANRPDLRKELIRKKWKLAIMAQTEVTYDIPEHRKYRLLPKIDDERLTPEQRANYNKPGGVGTMTGEQYWNVRGRGFGGEPDGENTTSCAEENLLGYPGTRYFGSSICVHEFSHGIMRGAIYTVDPEYPQSGGGGVPRREKAGTVVRAGISWQQLQRVLGDRHRGLRVRQRPRSRVAARGRSAIVRARAPGDPVDEDAGQRLRRAHARTAAAAAIGGPPPVHRIDVTVTRPIRRCDGFPGSTDHCNRIVRTLSSARPSLRTRSRALPSIAETVVVSSKPNVVTLPSFSFSVSTRRPTSRPTSSPSVGEARTTRGTVAGSTALSSGAGIPRRDGVDGGASATGSALDGSR